MGQGGGSGGSKEWSDSGYNLKMEPTQLAYEVDARSERKRGIKQDST